MTTQRYDPAMKDLVEVDPPSWPVLVGSPPGPTEAIDADIATVSGAGDKVLRVSAATPYLLHLEFVVGHDSATLARKLHLRNSLLGSRHDLRVRSAAILLRPEANSPRLTGRYEEAFPDDDPYLVFRYDVIRVWTLPPELLLSGGLGSLPLALISDVTEGDLAGIIERMERRLSSRRAKKQAQTIWAASYILLGLRFSRDLAAQLFRGIVSMKESVTYQMILEEGREEGLRKGLEEGLEKGLEEGMEKGMEEGMEKGRVEEAKRLLRLLAGRAFGAPSERASQFIDQVDDLARLERLLERILTARSWDELLNEEPTRRRGRGRSK